MTSCNVYPERYEQELESKAQKLQAMMAEFQPPTLEVFASRKQHYRMRMEFRVWHQGDDLFYAMFEPGDNRTPIRIDDCPMASMRINDTMFALLDAVRAEPLLSRRLFQIDFLSTLSGELMVTLIYHRKLDEQWETAARKLKQQFSIDLIGRCRGTKILMDRDFVIEKITVAGRELIYQQVENSFTQPNARMSEKMLEWALSASAGMGDDLLELYCGNGNFTVALAQNFERVMATEIAKTSVYSAQYNLEANQIENCRVVRLSSEEFTQAINKEREFRRLRGVDLDDYNFSTVLVDPPRAGLDSETEALVARYPNILYVSCNPETLKENLQHLTKTHSIERFALFDQFPYTHHVECGVFLRMKR